MRLHQRWEDKACLTKSVCAVAVYVICVLVLFFAQVALGQAQPDDSVLPDGTKFESWEQPLHFSKTYYVDGNAANADDSGPGTQQRPFRTISAAAKALQPGERAVIASGTYRECVRPMRGGTGPDKMISYEAAAGAKVIVKGSVVLKDGWEPSTGFRLPSFAGTQAKVWEIQLDPSLFEGYNPFGSMNMPEQRWQYMNRMSINVHQILVPYTRRRGMVFVDGRPLEQVRSYSELAGRDPAWASPFRGQPYSAEIFKEIGGGVGKYWIADNGLTLHVRLNGDDNPANHLVEVTVHEQVFAPEQPYLGYIRVKGITFEHAGNGFPDPQRGLVSTNRGHHWIIEGNTIQWANSIGLDVGRQYFGASLPPGPYGHHIIRGNVIRFCGISGISGLTARSLLVEDNLVEWVGWQDAEHMSESAGVKFHNATDLLFRNNVIRHMRHAAGIWLDIGNVNSRLTRNVFADIYSVHTAIWIEGTHKEDQIDNNIIYGVRQAEALTPPGVETGGGAGIYILGTDNLIITQNLFSHIASAGIHVRVEAERIVQGRGGTARNERVYNNIFHDCGTAAIEFGNEHNEADGNLYASMPGGFLSILYPQQRERLDLEAWRQFYKWDEHGQMANAKIELNPDTMELSFSTESPPTPVKVFHGVDTDFFGKRTGEMRLPGPFATLSAETVKVDPRDGRFLSQESQ
jgi:hypothetical protein